jgi:hypothetical protein
MRINGRVSLIISAAPIALFGRGVCTPYGGIFGRARAINRGWECCLRQASAGRAISNGRVSATRILSNATLSQDVAAQLPTRALVWAPGDPPRDSMRFRIKRFSILISAVALTAVTLVVSHHHYSAAPGGSSARVRLQVSLESSLEDVGRGLDETGEPFREALTRQDLFDIEDLQASAASRWRPRRAWVQLTALQTSAVRHLQARRAAACAVGAAGWPPNINPRPPGT